MRARQLPQPVLSRWLDLNEHCEALEDDARKAESEVARLRVILRPGTTDTTPAEFKRARDGFQDVFTDSQRARAKANAQTKLLASCKAWIEGLAPNTKLTLVLQPNGVASLDVVRAELQQQREALRKLRAYPPAAPDIEAKVRGYVSELARSALPQVRGYAQGQQLDVKWPGDTVDPSRNTGLLLLAALDPSELGELIIRAIVKEQPLSALEHAAQVAELEAQIDSLSYALAALTEKAGGEHDVALLPKHVLGVRIGETETAEAAA